MPVDYVNRVLGRIGCFADLSDVTAQVLISPLSFLMGLNLDMGIFLSAFISYLLMIIQLILYLALF